MASCRWYYEHKKEGKHAVTNFNPSHSERPFANRLTFYLRNNLMLTLFEYNSEIDSIAASLLDPKQYDQDIDVRADNLREYIDSHEFVICQAEALSVILHSSNSEYVEEQGFLGEELIPFWDAVAHKAFWAMYADVIERMEQLEQEAIVTGENDYAFP
jgi:hypothetical protein